MHHKKLTCSVAIATYNGEKYILEQLKSIINQSVLPDEIVISDDGSSDNTIGIVKQFIQTHVDNGIEMRLIKNRKEKRGVLGNFENAILNTTEDIIFLSDQDDIWLENKVETVLSLFKENNVDMVLHDSELLINDLDSFVKSDKTLFSISILRSLTNQTERLRKEDYLNNAVSYCFIQGMCMAFSRALLNRSLPFPTCSRNHDDWLLFCGVAMDSCVATKDVLTYYRIHENNTCGVKEFNKKRSIKDKIATFNERSLSSIRGEYEWSTHVYNFLDCTYDDLNPIQRRYCFYNMNERTQIIRKNRIIAAIRLTKAYFKKKYVPSGKIVYFHDLTFCLIHSKKYRNDFVNSFIK